MAVLHRAYPEGRFEVRPFRLNLVIRLDDPQPDLPADPQILRTAAQQNQAHVGGYASVVQGGLIRRGDAVGVVE